MFALINTFLSDQIFLTLSNGRVTETDPNTFQKYYFSPAREAMRLLLYDLWIKTSFTLNYYDILTYPNTKCKVTYWLLQ